jgi:tetratricopeptide (TPR) repeat protein
VNNKNIGAHVMLGMVHQHQGSIAESNDSYSATLDLSLSNAIDTNSHASSLAEFEGNLDEALKFAKMTRELAPEDPGIVGTLGWVYYLKGLADSAMPLFEEAAEKLPENPIVRYHCGAVLAKQGSTKKAKAEIEAALKKIFDFYDAEMAKEILDELQQK